MSDDDAILCAFVVACCLAGALLTLLIIRILA